jgi:hypothetical protein
VPPCAAGNWRVLAINQPFSRHIKALIPWVFLAAFGMLVYAIHRLRVQRSSGVR